MINELARFPTRSENVYFANNEQALIAVFTAVFYFTHEEHQLIKLKGNAQFVQNTTLGLLEKMVAQYRKRFCKIPRNTRATISVMLLC